MKLLNRRFSNVSFIFAAVFLAAVQLMTAQTMRPTPAPRNQPMGGMTAKPDAQMQQVLDNLAALKPIPIETLSPGEARYQPAFPDALKQTIQKKTKMYPMPEPVGKVEDLFIPGAVGQIAARIYTPPGNGLFPVIVYYHGGGFVIASINAYDSSARALTNGAGAIVVAIEYRKAPEARFPAAHDDSFAAYQWVLANAASFGGDAKRVAVVGESAGGNLAANVSIMARDKNVQAPLAQILVYPIADNDMNAPSIRENTSPRLTLNAPKLPWFYSYYLNTPAESNDPRISLVKANLRNLPPTTIINAQIDRLRSEGELLARKMREAGVTVDQKTYNKQVFAFNNQMPTGVTVSQTGRIFVNYPRWEDKVAFTVAEIKNGREVPFPDAALNRLDETNPAAGFVSVQSVVVDPRDRLWIVDTGSINLMPIISQDAPKLVCVDLTTNKIIKTVRFTSNVILPTTYLNDIRFDLRQGAEGTAYLTDSSSSGPNALIVVDLASGRSRRLLNGHPSVSPEPLFTATVEGKDLKQRKPNEPPMHIRLGADGIAISADGSRIYYCPLASRKLYSVSTEALLDEGLSETEVAAAVKDEGAKPAPDGLESDAEGRIYATDYENRGIKPRVSGGGYETLVRDSRVVWAYTMSVAPNGYLYFTSNQLNRQAGYNNGRDLRKKPYHLFRVKIDGTPISLK